MLANPYWFETVNRYGPAFVTSKLAIVRFVPAASAMGKPATDHAQAIGLPDHSETVRLTVDPGEAGVDDGKVEIDGTKLIAKL